MFHLTQKRIEAHVTICFAAYKVYLKSAGHVLKAINHACSSAMQSVVDRFTNL